MSTLTNKFLKRTLAILAALAITLTSGVVSAQAAMPDTVNLTVHYKDPALVKIEADREKATVMPDNIRQKLRDLTRQLKTL